MKGHFFYKYSKCVYLGIKYYMDLNKKLKRLRNEDLIWIIYFFIAGFALLSNHYDRIFLLNKDYGSYQKEKVINVGIFFVSFFIYLYFVLLIIDDLNTMEQNFENPEFRATCLKLIAATLFLIGGTIYLYVEATTGNPGDVGIIS